VKSQLKKGATLIHQNDTKDSGAVTDNIWLLEDGDAWLTEDGDFWMIE
jgi:hypothetical protein